MATPPLRIGLSATQNPIELVASFLTGVHEGRKPATIVQVGQRRERYCDRGSEPDELSSVTNNGMWEEIFDKLAAHAQNHRSTLVFNEYAAAGGEDCICGCRGGLDRSMLLHIMGRCRGRCGLMLSSG